MKRKITGMLLALLLCLTACTGGGGTGEESPDVSPTPAVSPAVGEVTTYPVPLENRRAQQRVCPSSQTDGYYWVGGNIVKFWTPGGGEAVTLCAQPGCEHKDESCQAWIGDVKNYTEYYGNLYAIRGSVDVDLVRKNLTDGSITVLAEWKSTDTTYHDGHLGQVADGQAVVLIRSNEQVDPNSLDTVQRDQYWLIDVETGEQRRIFQGEEEHIFDVQAHSRDYAVVRYWDTSKSQRLSLEEYMAQYGGDEEEYRSYVWETEYYELRLYHWDTGEYQVLTDTNQGYYPTADPNTTYGYDVVYVVGDGVFLVNAETGQTRQLLALEEIVNYWTLDHKVFLISHVNDADDPDDPMILWYADITDGELVRMENGGNTDYMVYSMMAEGESFFMDGMGFRLSKQDFYAENYENVF